MKHQIASHAWPAILQQAGLRATKSRIRLLHMLESEHSPVSVYQLEKKINGAMNQTTIYRTLDALSRTGIVTRVHLEHDHAHFELTLGRAHHHHAICRSCGTVEDIEVPHPTHPEREALKRTKRFSRLDSYSLEFFGLCKKCSK